MEYAPIALFVYNRPDHALKTLEALSINQGAEKSKLYIFADGPKQNVNSVDLDKIQQTRTTIEKKKWCGEVEIIYSEKNKGLAKSITEGVNLLLNKYGKIIVLEDDIVTSQGFLSFMNNSLSYYENEEKVMHIGGFLPPNQKLASTLETPFFSPFMSCWGWATWKRAWDKINLNENELHQYLQDNNSFNEYNLDGTLEFHKQLEDNISGKISTWAIKWYSSIFIEKGLCLYPHHSMVQNIGQDGSGVHSGTMYYNPYYIEKLLESETIPSSLLIEESQVGREYLKSFYNNLKKKSFRRYMIKAFNKIQTLLK
ncbi:glycosyltransferase family protein [Sediminitomix flava]|uniref:Glycosyl transferase family 2 n=1 Tax=Sediminitomix flava TaxID=379075 RepID=A0A315Z8E1_SEDFL|nr:hypothetical protein [Sediminitomix flava]PWJ40825.1 hypothetical protein BC781_10484 [Sediminitomix flava]